MPYTANSAGPVKECLATFQKRKSRLFPGFQEKGASTGIPGLPDTLCKQT